jgi:hypothetical protein
MTLFLRRWRITIGTLQTEDLDCSFKITRTLRATPGTCELTVRNLSASQRGEAQALRRGLVRVEAGYESSGVFVLFQGNSRRVTIKREGDDWTTKVTAGDGEFAIRQARGGRSFGPQSRITEVVEYIAEAMSVGVGNTREALASSSLDRVGEIFPRGHVSHGQAAEQLTALLRSARIEWSVQNGVLQLLPTGRALQREAILLAPDSGLIESPERGQHGEVKVKALLIPDLVPGRLIQIQSEVVSGLYRIEKTETTGDTAGAEWFVNCTAKAPPP